MRLLEAIVDANHRASAGDVSAGIHPTDFADSLPLVMLTCIDPRLNLLFPEVLGVTKEQFIWLRGAGNIITSPLSSPVRSFALACANNRAREIAVIGHTDCLVCKTTAVKLTESLAGLGVNRNALPENLTEFFGLFASERQNVIKGVDNVRRSPLIGPKIPVHGLIVDVVTGKLEWVVNGYQALEQLQSGEMKFPENKIGQISTQISDRSQEKAVEPVAQPPVPPRIQKPGGIPPR